MSWSRLLQPSAGLGDLQTCLPTSALLQCCHSLTGCQNYDFKYYFLALKTFTILGEEPHLFLFRIFVGNVMFSLSSNPPT